MIFLLDANFPPQLARALQALDQEDCEYRHSPDEFGADAPDEVIFAGNEDRDWFLMTLDAKMSRRRAPDAQEGQTNLSGRRPDVL